MNAQIKDIIGRMTADGEQGAGPKLDFNNPANTDQDFESICLAVGDMAAKKWGRQSAMTGIKSDAQIATIASTATVHAIAGAFMKQPLKTVWADGDFITISDGGAELGDTEVEWLSQGRRTSSPDDGIMAPDRSPERAVGIANKWQRANLVPIVHKIEIGMMETARADRIGYSVFTTKGQQLNDAHKYDVNNVLRRGNAKYKVHGICNFPGIRHRSAAVDWGTANADVIYDDYNAAINEIYVSDTEEDMPAMSVLARRQYRHIQTENFGSGTDTTLKKYIEDNNGDHTIHEDPGMRQADLFGNPGALFFTPRPDLVRCIAPMWMNVMQPHDESEFVISITIMTYLAGVIVTNTDSVLFVDGTAAGWT